uniref:HTH OST-type domain-containing protein n=1 Tax=Eptatretus burgeri TaxID=7764 RepID=A0A8C4R951_EPTBU
MGHLGYDLEKLCASVSHHICVPSLNRSYCKLNLFNELDIVVTIPPSLSVLLICTGLSKNLSTFRKNVPAISREVLQKRLRDILQCNKFGIWHTGLQEMYHEMFQEDMPLDVLQHLRDWSHICSVCLMTKPGMLMLLGYCNYWFMLGWFLYPPSPQLPSPIDKRAVCDFPVILDSDSMDSLGEHKCRIYELLRSYPAGVWFNSLHDMYKAMYDMDLPVLFIDNVDLLSDIGSIECPLPNNPQKAIIYPKVSSRHEVTPTSGFIQTPERTSLNPRLFESSIPQNEPPVLVAPKEDFPSVVVLHASSTRRVAFRYFGSKHSEMLDKLEEAMLKEYNSHDLVPYFNASDGQLVAAFVDGYWYRARVISTDDAAAQITVSFNIFYFFCLLPSCLFPLTYPCKGLESLCVDAAVLSRLELFAKDKTLVMEVIKHSEIPEVVLYDTSGDEDVQVNLACLQQLEDPFLAALPKVWIRLGGWIVDGGHQGLYKFPIFNLTRTKIWLDFNPHIFSSPSFFSCLLNVEFFFFDNVVLLFKHFCDFVQVTNIRESVVSVLLLDVGKTITCDYSALYEVPAFFLRDFASIPVQVFVQFCVASVQVHPQLLYVHLFTSLNLDDDSQTVNKMLAAHCASLDLEERKPVLPISCKILPPPQQLPERGKRMDVFVSVACHPGLFALQPWLYLSDLHELTDNMRKRYARDEARFQLKEPVSEGLVCAAMVEGKSNFWYRVLVKSLPSPNMALVYQLDYGPYKMVNTRFLCHLDPSFLELPFQAIWADLEAAVAASFRYLVEGKPMVAWVCELAGKNKHPWDRRFTVTLVDTSRPSVDCYIRDMVEGFLTSFSKLSEE